jgi:E3 ubiquitin-protein ligase SHPRH
LRDAVAALCLSIPGPSSTNEPQTLTLQAFYDAVCVPERDRPHLDLPVAEIQGLSARLYPFQRRSVQWLLNREGVQWCLGTESLEPIMKPYQPETPATPISFLPVKDASGESFAISPLFGVVMRDPSPSLQFQNFQGGILAEEMGLGKTLEIISLILLHRRPDEGSQVFDPKLRRHLPASKGTLIITPASLLDQWVSEIQRHAPELDVMHYPGLRSLTKGQREEIGRDLGCHDVVVTTYDVLRTEIYAAMDPPERSMRGGQRHERARSPLVEFSWWRVCIDEAQMVEKWQSNTATMARLIPRVNAWAITGTPVKDSLQGGMLLRLHETIEAWKC